MAKKSPPTTMKPAGTAAGKPTDNRLFPILESKDARKQRYRRGYTKIVEIDARAFLKDYEKAHGEKLAQSASRVAALRRVDGPIDAYPQITLTADGVADVVDGRHRLALAAERGETIQVAVSAGDQKAVYEAFGAREVARPAAAAARKVIGGSVKPSEQEIRKLVGFYRESVERIARNFFDAVDFQRPRLFSILQENMAILDRLDARAETWASRNIAKLYNAVQRGSARDLADLGLTKRAVADASKFAVINQEAVEALLWDPQVGFVSSLKNASQEIRDRMVSIHRQSKLLEAQGKSINETIARVGIMEGKNLETVKEALMKEIVQNKAVSEQVFRPALSKQGPQSILGNLSNLTHVTFPTANGGERTIRLDDYAETLARTKTAQATGLARRNQLLRAGQELVKVSENFALQDDACNLFIGRVFAMTKAAADEWDVPHVSELPSGGCPFHPNCTHDEQGYFVELHEDDDAEELKATFSRPPAWALNRRWNEVQKEYVKRGGNDFGQKNNPNYARAHTTGGRERAQGRR